MTFYDGDAPRVHRPIASVWLCAEDGSVWPCPGYKGWAWRKVRGDLEAVHEHMSGWVAAARDDLPDATDRDVFDRFVGWAVTYSRTPAALALAAEECGAVMDRRILAAPADSSR